MIVLALGRLCGDYKKIKEKKRKETKIKERKRKEKKRREEKRKEKYNLVYSLFDIEHRRNP